MRLDVTTSTHDIGADLKMTHLGVPKMPTVTFGP